MKALRRTFGPVEFPRRTHDFIPSQLPNNFKICNSLKKNQELKISVLNVNIRSLNAHFDELTSYLRDMNVQPTVIALTETWLKDYDDIEQFTLPGYHKLLTCNRSDGLRGGVAIWLDKNFKYRVVVKDTVREWLVIETFSPHNLFLAVSYRREKRFSKNEYCEWLHDELNARLNGKKSKVVICGDFNIDLLVPSKHSTELVDIMLSHNLKLSSPLKVTRQYGNSKTCLDHIYSDLVISNNKILRSSITDHFMAFAEYEERYEIKASLPDQWYRDYSSLEKKPILKKFNNMIQSNLSATNWGDVSIDNGFKILTDTIIKAANLFAPMKKVRLNKKDWLDNSIKRSIHKRDMLFSQFTKDPGNQELRNDFVKQRNATKLLIRQKKREHIQNIFERNHDDVKGFHRQLNRVIGKSKDPVTPTFTPTKTVNDFNNYFCEVGIKNQQSIEKTPFAQNNSGYTMHSMFLRRTSVEEVISIISNAKNKTSTGVDGISNRLLKYCCSVVSSPLEILFNRCMNLSYFPDQFKIAKIIPIFKEGNKDDFSNYRPISLLPAISKVFERIIFKRAYSYVEKFKLLDDNQFGFRKKETL